MLRYFVYKQLGWDKRGKWSKEKHWDKLLDIDLHHSIEREELTIKEQLTWREISSTYIYLPYILVAEPIFKSAILRAVQEGTPKKWIEENILELQRIHAILKYHKRGDYKKSSYKNLKKKLPSMTLKSLLS
jgi:hypothetical protein